MCPSSLKEVKTFDELLLLLPALVKLKEKQKEYWEQGTGVEDFLVKFLHLFNAGELIVWADFNKEVGEFDYFMAVVKEDDNTAMFWLFYIDIRLRTISGELANISIDKIKELGYNKIQLTTTRITKSYSRWMDKLGFEPVKLMYERKL